MTMTKVINGERIDMTPEEEAEHIASRPPIDIGKLHDEMTNSAFDIADMKTTVDGFWILISAIKTANIPLGVAALDALSNDAAGKAGFIDLWKQRFKSYL